ncbi:beta-lactamase class A [Peribacillus deserti]|uniref:Beta-lactamase class A n=1 Tax=Peribacillus deserti TaxID=673318 RepID=A0ABS2QIU9_9BACI|nr:serine hydrolase [Peribacillus deserti]MBM7693067.1 beta-lactamase class A [Peribacillus deserti]
MVVTSLDKILKEQLNLTAGRVSVTVEIHGERYEHNSKEVFLSASLIKLPILIAAYRESEKGKLFLHRPISVPHEEKTGGSGVIQVLSEGITYTIKDLLTLMIIISDNTATNVCIDLIGLESINRTIREMGLEQTVLGRKMMDWDAVKEGKNNYISASDMLLCLKAINQEGYLTENSRSDILKIMQSQQFSDKLPALIDRENVTVANKTGELPGVEHDCAIISFKEKTAYAAVLTDGLKNQEEGRIVIRNIGKAVCDYLVAEG